VSADDRQDRSTAAPAPGAAAGARLADLRGEPFRLLLEMERLARRARIGADDDGSADAEWTGIAVRIGEFRLLTPREDVMEVMMAPAVTRVPGAQPWLRGVTQLRGQLVPITDLRVFLLDEPVRPLDGARILVTSHRQIPAGLVVDEVFGFRRLPESRRRVVDLDGLPLRVRPCVDSGFWLEDRVWPVVQLRSLTETDRFLDPAV
jgi:twitching motility protein PilI